MTDRYQVRSAGTFAHVVDTQRGDRVVVHHSTPGYAEQRATSLNQGPKLTPQQQELDNAVRQLDRVLGSVVPTSTAHYAIEGLRAAVRAFDTAPPVTTYDVHARQTALSLGEELDES